MSLPPNNIEQLDAEADVIVSIRSLWKVFGAESQPLPDELRQADKKTIQEQTGLVVGLRDIDFEIKKGEFFVIMGLSGSGKSTLIRCLIRLIEPTEGEIRINGQDICQFDEKSLMKLRRNTTSMVFQAYGLLPHYTVLQNAAYGLQVRGDAKDRREERARQALETVGLAGWEDYKPGSLSGGMQQRVGLARALATDPEVLLMDEPFSGLDPLIRRQMQDELAELQKKVHKTIVFVTHDLDEALMLGDRIAIMRDGEVIQLATPEQILTEPADDYVKDFVANASPTKVLTAGTIMDESLTVLSSDLTPKEAMEMLEENDKDYGFVIDTESKYLGIATAPRLSRLERRKDMQLTHALKPEHPTAAPQSSVEEVIALAVSTRYPVPVVDENGTFLGEIDNSTILRCMVASEKEAD